MPIQAGDVLFKIGSNITQVEADLARLKQQFVSAGGSATSSFSAASKPIDALQKSLANSAVSADKLGNELAETGKQGQQAFIAANSAAGAFQSSMSTLKSVAQGLGLTFGALGFAQAIRAGVSAAAEFQQAWTRVSVILRDSDAGVLDEFKEKILALPPALGTAAENARAFYQIISSGFSKPAEALELLKNSAIAAAGGFTTTEIAVKAGAAVLQAYGLEVSRSREIFDTMAKTVDLGVVTFEELASELGQIIPIAASNNVSFKELSGGIAALTLQGLPASQAITGLRSTIASIISPSEKAVEVAQRLGIRWDEHILKAKGLSGTLKQLENATRDQANSARVSAEDVNILTGRIEATNAVMALTSTSGAKKLADAIKDLGDASKGAGASATSLAAAQKTVAFQFKELKNEISNAAASIGDSWAPAIASGIAGIRAFGSSAKEVISTTASFWASATKGADGAMDAVVAVDQAFGGLGSAIAKLTGVGPAFVALSRVIGATEEDVSSLITTMGKMTGLGPAFSSLSEALQFIATDTTAITTGFIAWGAALAGLKIAAMVSAVGGLSGVFQAMSASIAASTASAGFLSLALAALPYAVIAAAIAGIGAAWYAASKAEEEFSQSLREADALMVRLAADTLRKYQQANDQQGVAAVQRLTVEFKTGKLSAEQFQIAIGKLTNDLAKFNPGQYFKESTVKAISAMVDQLGVKSTGALLDAAKEASAVVTAIQTRLKGFTGTTQENALVQRELTKAIEVQNTRWNDYKKEIGAVGTATASTGKETKKVVDEFDKLASSVGASIPKLREQVKIAQQYVDESKKAGKSSAELLEAERLLATAKKALADVTKEETQRFLEWRDSTKLAREQLDRVIESIRTYKGLNFGAGLEADISKINTGVASLERMGVAMKPFADSFAEAENAMKSLGITSTEMLRLQVAETNTAYDTIIAKYGEASREGELAWVALTEAQIALARKSGEEIPRATIEAVDKIKAKYGELKETSDKTFTSAAEVARKQVSTIFTDFSKGFADILFSAGSFGKKITDLFAEIGKSIVRGFLESGLLGIFSGEGMKGFTGFLSGLKSSIGSLFGGGAGGAGGLANAAAGLVPGGSLLNALGGGGGLASLLGIGGAAAGAGGLIAGGVGGSLASIAAAGTVPSFLLASGTVAGTAGAGGIGGGLAAGGAAGGISMASLGAFMTNPWTIGIAAAIAGGILLTNKLTQRGRDKETATGSAEEGTGAEGLSAQVWQKIIPAVKEGNLSIEEGMVAVKDAWAKYELFLQNNVKDQVVVQRSLDTQRVTLTQSLAELDEMSKQLEEKKKQLGTEGLASIRGFLDEMARTGQVSDEAIAGLKAVTEQMLSAGLAAEAGAGKLGVLGAEFLKTGQMTNEFQSALEAAGGSSSFFTRITGELQKLQGLRMEFGSLKQMIDSLLPVTKSWQQQFFETGVITDEMTKKIKEAGGNLEDFKKFADMQAVKTEFESLAAEFDKTGVASDRLLELLKQFASPELYAQFIASMQVTGETVTKTIKDTFESAAQGITDIVSSFALLRNEWDQNKTVSIDALAMIRKFADPITLAAFEKLIAESQKTGKSLGELAMGSKEAAATIAKAFASAGTNVGNLQQDFKLLKAEFDQTGVVSDKLLAILKGYVDPTLFKAFEALIAQAKASGISIFELGNQSAAFAATIKSAFDSTEAGIGKVVSSLGALSAEWVNHKTISASAVEMIRKFADAETLKAFEDLIAESVRTGKSLSELAAGSTAASTTISIALNSAGANALKLRNDFTNLKAEFDQTGVVSDKLLGILRDYSDPAIFKSFQDLIDQAKASGVSIFDLGRQSTDAADIIKAVFGSAGESIDKEFTTAAENLSATLAKMDENLGKSIGALQTAMVTMIKNLIDVILQVPGAAKKAADDANFFLGQIHDRDVRVTFNATAPGLADLENRISMLGNIRAAPGFTPAPPNPVVPFVPTTSVTGRTGARVDLAGGIQVVGAFQKGGMVPRTGLARVDAGELVLPEKASNDLGNLLNRLEGYSETPYAESITKLSKMPLENSSGPGASVLFEAIAALQAGMRGSINELGGQIGAAIRSLEERLAIGLSEFINADAMLASVSRRSLDLLAESNAVSEQSRESNPNLGRDRVEINQTNVFQRQTDAREERRMLERVNDALVNQLNVY